MNFKKVAVIGLGLIGGSILKEKKKKKEISVIGYSKKKDSVEIAMKQGWIKEGYYLTQEKKNLFNEDLKTCDLIIFCTPISIILKQLEKIKPFLAENTILTDVGSTKREIIKKAKELNIKNFIGSHPIAGAEQSGIQASININHLFQDKLVIICSEKIREKILTDKQQGRRGDLEKIIQLEKFWQSLDKRIRIKKMSPEEHDKIYAFVSHFPHLLSSLLMQQGAKVKGDKAIYGTGFKSMTRLAKGDKEVWKDILATNTDFILEAMKNFKDILEELSRIIEKKEEKKLIDFLGQSKQNRENLD